MQKQTIQSLSADVRASHATGRCILLTQRNIDTLATTYITVQTNICISMVQTTRHASRTTFWFVDMHRQCEVTQLACI